MNKPETRRLVAHLYSLIAKIDRDVEIQRGSLATRYEVNMGDLVVHGGTEVRKALVSALEDLGWVYGIGTRSRMTLDKAVIEVGPVTVRGTDESFNLSGYVAA